MTTDEIILKKLQEISPKFAREDHLVAWVNEDLMHPLSRKELALKLDVLEKKGWVTFILDEINRDLRKWLITEHGKAILVAR